MSRTRKWAVEHAELEAMLSVDLDKMPPQRMTAGEWEDYGRWIAEGNHTAQQEFMLRSLRRVYGTAKKFSDTLGSDELTVEDHFHNAIEGMLAGIRRWSDEPSKYTFFRYAVGMSIWGELSGRAMHRGLILNTGFFQNYEKLETARSEIVKQPGNNEDEITTDELADASGMDKESVASLVYASQVFDYEHLEPMPFMEDEGLKDLDAEDRLDRVINIVAAQNTVRDVLPILTYRQRAILKQRFGLDGEQVHNLQELGNYFNVTRQRAQQIEAEAMRIFGSLTKFQELRESYEVEIPASPAQIKQQKIRKGKEDVARTILKVTPIELDNDYWISSILEARDDHGEVVGALCGLIIQGLQQHKRPDESMSKNVLASRIEIRLGLPKGQLNHADFVRALRSLEDYGIINCRRNERGTVIESIDWE